MEQKPITFVVHLRYRNEPPVAVTLGASDAEIVRRIAAHVSRKAMAVVSPEAAIEMIAHKRGLAGPQIAHAINAIANDQGLRAQTLRECWCVDDIPPPDDTLPEVPAAAAYVQAHLDEITSAAIALCSNLRIVARNKAAVQALPAVLLRPEALVTEAVRLPREVVAAITEGRRILRLETHPVTVTIAFAGRPPRRIRFRTFECPGLAMYVMSFLA